MKSISADVHTGDCGDPVWLDDEGRAMIVNSHHYTAESICALIAELKRFEDPQQSTQADWDNKDWRTMCGVLWHVMAGLANDVPLASRPFGFVLVPVNPTTDMLFAGSTAMYRASHGELDAATEEMKAAWLAMLAAAPSAEPTRSQKLTAAGFTRRPTWKSLPSDDDAPSAPDHDCGYARGSVICRYCDAEQSDGNTRLPAAPNPEKPE